MVKGDLFLINEKDVIRMKIPYPSVSGDLAVSSHMYICKKAQRPEFHFLKCQTLKPYMLINKTTNHYCDELPDINRNPFITSTRIDCDKLFIADQVSFSLKMRTTTRHDVCDDLFSKIISQLTAHGYYSFNLCPNELTKLNYLITKVTT